MNYRRIIFYLKDLIRGGIISKHLKDIDAIIKDPISENSKKKKEKRKSEILEHAVKNVPFYRNNVLIHKSSLGFTLILETGNATC